MNSEVGQGVYEMSEQAIAVTQVFQNDSRDTPTSVAPKNNGQAQLNTAISQQNLDRSNTRSRSKTDLGISAALESIPCITLFNRACT